jgi:hypothetical protein
MVWLVKVCRVDTNPLHTVQFWVGCPLSSLSIADLQSILQRGQR